jgi:hypothetical protein
MTKKWQKAGFPETKKVRCKAKNNGFSKTLDHISPTFDDSSDPPGQKKTLGPARFSF